MISEPPVIEEIINENDHVVTVAHPDAQRRHEPESSDFNKLITAALVILVLGGIIWPFYSNVPGKIAFMPLLIPTLEIIKNPFSAGTPIVTTVAPAVPTITPVVPAVAPAVPTITSVLPTVAPAVTAIPEAQPTGRKIGVKTDRRKGFFSLIQGTLRIKPGDDVVWINEGLDPVTLVSSEALFESRLIDYDKRANYTFKNSGTYGFYLKENINLNMIIIIEP